MQTPAEKETHQKALLGYMAEILPRGLQWKRRKSRDVVVEKERKWFGLGMQELENVMIGVEKTANFFAAKRYFRERRLACHICFLPFKSKIKYTTFLPAQNSSCKRNLTILFPFY